MIAVLLTGGACKPDRAGLPGVERSTARAASLVVFVRDAAGRPVEGCSVLIGAVRLGALSDSQGRGLIVDIHPGTWVVSWHLTGALSDSTQVKFTAGAQETLTTVLRFESEPPNPYEKLPK